MASQIRNWGGVSYNLTSVQKDSLVMEIIPFDDYNHRLHPCTDFVGSVLPTWGNHALTNGWKLIEIYETEADERGVLVEGKVY